MKNIHPHRFYFRAACGELKSLFLSNASLVTDIGIRYIADGCHHIEHLNREFILHYFPDNAFALSLITSLNYKTFYLSFGFVHAI